MNINRKRLLPCGKKAERGLREGRAGGFVEVTTVDEKNGK
ncbi:hypothetical protein BRYFOR_06127 [Marvinbryantia formatexigens DSM 14469]|uniref:Uncharacterized protein n=1 Tax=Marvinbryantia formatexigens DSM 14469 TaxID=478749 RepID=C6LBY2_9FIRM|nr:hypothetical protein BRYFOR_06127 [Marvinbryantia formatexigens DSM 14469]